MSNLGGEIGDRDEITLRESEKILSFLMRFYMAGWWLRLKSEELRRIFRGDIRSSRWQRVKA